MPGIPFKYSDTFRLLRRATEQLHALMESGEFHTYGYLKRRALLRRVRKLYNRLSGPVSPAILRGATLAIGALALAGCTQPTDPVDDPAPTSQTPSFAAVQINPLGIDNGDPSIWQYHRSPVVLGDIDGDGDLDLLYTSTYGESVDIVVQRGNGSSFGAVEVEPFGLTLYGLDWMNDWYYKPLHLIDVDGDGRVDLVGIGSRNEYDPEYSIYHEGLIFIRNTGSTGSPSFADPVPLGPSGEIPNSYAARAIAFVDIDGDGDLDLVTATQDNLYLTLNTSGSASLADFSAAAESTIEFPYPSVIFPIDFRINGMAIVDLDKDGDLDLLVSGYTATYEEGFGGYVTEPMLIYFENTSTAAGFSFASGQVNPFGISFPARQWAEWDYYYWYNRSTPLSLAAADVDGDGDIDLLLGINVSYDVEADGYLSEFFYFENKAIP